MQPTLNSTEIRVQMRQFICTNFYLSDPTVLSDEASLIELGFVDSTGVLELITYLEETYGIEIEDNELIPENLDSVDRLVKFVGRKKAG